MSYLFIGVMVIWLGILGYMFKINLDQKEMSRKLNNLTK